MIEQAKLAGIVGGDDVVVEGPLLEEYSRDMSLAHHSQGIAAI